MDTVKKKMTFAQKIMASVGLGLFVGFVLSVMVPIINAPDQTILRDAWAAPPTNEMFGYPVIYDVPPVQIEEKVSVFDKIGEWTIDRLNSLGKIFMSDAERREDAKLILAATRISALEANADYVISEDVAEPVFSFALSSVGYGPGSPDSLPAFWGCEGPGCGAGQQFRPNGRRICRVANLNNSGAGSLQACAAIIEADSNTTNKPLDIVVFDTAGAIYWNPTCPSSGCQVWRGAFILAQSAPGPVVLYQWPFQMKGGSEDVLIRGLAFRGMPVPSYSFQLEGYRAISYNNSVSHGGQRGVKTDAVGSDYGPWDSTDVSRYHTWARNFISYKTTQRVRGAPLSVSPTMWMYTSQPRPAPLMSNIAAIKNVVLGAKPCPSCAVGSTAPYRVPNINADTVWMHNNLITMIHAGNQWTVSTDGAVVDHTYSEYRAGGGISSSRTSATYYPFAQDTLDACTWISNDTTPSLCDTSLYYQKNHVSHHGDGSYGDTLLTQDSIWRGSKRQIGTYDPQGGTYVDSSSPPLGNRRNTPLTYTAPFGFDTIPLSLANMNTILDSAGAGFRIDSLGAVYMARDTVDRRARAAVIDTVQYVRPGDTNADSFLVDYFPNWSLDVDPKCRDEDDDAMCDAWEELAYGDTSLVAASIRASGYSAIELAYMGGIENVDTVFGGTPVTPSFRGAKGHGAETFAACRELPLKVIPVTTTTAGGGTGTSDSAIRAIAPDSFNIIIYTIGGVINGEITLTDEECVWVAGQTAPGGGIAYTK